MDTIQQPATVLDGAELARMIRDNRPAGNRGWHEQCGAWAETGHDCPQSRAGK